MKYFKDPNPFLHLVYKHFFIYIFVKRTPADKFNYIYLSKLVIIPIQYSVKTANKWDKNPREKLGEEQFLKVTIRKINSEKTRVY